MPEEVKKYRYKETEYTLNPVTLGVLKYAAPLVAKLRKLQHEYTHDINTEELIQHEQRINELSTAISQVEKELGGDSVNEQTEHELSTQLESLCETLYNENFAFESNAELQSTLKLYNECRAFAVMEAISDTELVGRFIQKAVSPAAGKDVGNICIEINDLESVDFVKEVIVDFFYLIAGKKPPAHIPLC
jgi:hypothetical protein